MNRPPVYLTLLAGLALAIAVDVRWVAADSVRVPIRSANAKTRQLDPNAIPSPAPLSPTPLPSAPVPGQPAMGGSSLPPHPVPDNPTIPPRAPSSNGGGAMYRGPLGADFQAPPAPKKEFLGDHPGGAPLPMMDGSGQPLPGQPLSGQPFTGQPLPGSNPSLMSVPFAGSDGYGMAPPPGTLGQTYKRRSRLIDDEKHPRVGMVDVYLSENYEVTAKGMKVKRLDKVWRLESDPLWPGIPHIIEVKSEWGPEGAKQQQVRFVRLIMGRIVDLEF